MQLMLQSTDTLPLNFAFTGKARHHWFLTQHATCIEKGLHSPCISHSTTKGQYVNCWEEGHALFVPLRLNIIN